MYGLIGGLIPDAIRIINNRYNPVLPEYLKSPSFYIGTLLLVVLGGGSAPQIVSSVLQQKANLIAPPVDGGDTGTRGGPTLFETETKKPSMRGWWGM